MPDVVLVDFPSYAGPPFVPENPKLIPIIPVERRMNDVRHCCRRKQIPLRLGWATTIPKYQLSVNILLILEQKALKAWSIVFIRLNCS